MYAFKDLSSAILALLRLRDISPFEEIHPKLIRVSLDIAKSILTLVILAGPLIMSCIT